MATQEHVLGTYGRAPIEIVRGEGSYLYDGTGKRYVDFCSGIATVSLGHANPVVTRALAQQAEKLMHCSNLYTIPQQEELAELIVREVVQSDGQIFFCNSGAEANDGIIKVARRFGHRHPASDGTPRYEVITFLKSFHGRTLGSMAATGQKKVQVEFDPLLVGFKYVEFNDIEALRAAVGKETCGILLEAVQGEGGVKSGTGTPPARTLRLLARSHSRNIRLPSGGFADISSSIRASPSQVCPRVRRVAITSPPERASFTCSSGCQGAVILSGKPRPLSSRVPGRRICPHSPPNSQG